jgi:hypothetical protein
MRSATVKRALGGDAERVTPGVDRRRGVEHLDPTPATDAVLADQTAGYVRLAVIRIGWLVGSMALIALVMVYLDQRPGEPFRLSRGLVDALLIVAAVTGLLGMTIFFGFWHRGRMLVLRLTPEQRRSARSTGMLHVQDRLTLVNSHEHWLKAPGSDWMLMDVQLLDGLEPHMEASQRNDLRVGRQTGNDVAEEWIVRDATILFHPSTRTVIEILDASGDLVYRHPKYRPQDVV